MLLVQGDNSNLMFFFKHITIILKVKLNNSLPQKIKLGSVADKGDSCYFMSGHLCMVHVANAITTPR
jgi:hypothetical protein